MAHSEKDWVLDLRSLFANAAQLEDFIHFQSRLLEAFHEDEIPLATATSMRESLKTIDPAVGQEGCTIDKTFQRMSIAMTLRAMEGALKNRVPGS